MKSNSETTSRLKAIISLGKEKGLGYLFGEGSKRYVPKRIQGEFNKVIGALSKKEIYLVRFDGYWASYIPYAYLFIGHSLKKAGFSYKILHNSYARTVDRDINNFAHEVLAAKPLWVGVSVITGRSSYYSALFSRIIKENSDIPIVWGGIHTTILPDQCLKQDYVDYVILDEGEERAVQFTHALLDGKDFSKLDGVGYKEDGRVIINPPVKKVDVNTIDIDWDHNLKRYIERLGSSENRSLSYTSSRGCPYRCDFCVNMSLNNRRWRPFPESKVLDDVSYLKKKYNISHVPFTDDNFFVDKERAFRILNQIDLKYTADSMINYMTEEFIKSIAATKRCTRLIAGGESGADSTLRRIHKAQTKEIMLRAAGLIGKYNLPSTWQFIIGFPTETLEEIYETFEFIRLLEETVGFRFCNPGLYIPYPGTILYNLSVGKGFHPPQTPEEWIICERYRDSRRPSESSISYPWVDVRKLSSALQLRAENRPLADIKEQLLGT